LVETVKGTAAPNESGNAEAVGRHESAMAAQGPAANRQRPRIELTGARRQVFALVGRLPT